MQKAIWQWQRFQYAWCAHPFNKLMKFFFASVLLLMLNCIITLSKWLCISQATSERHKKLTSICFYNSKTPKMVIEQKRHNTAINMNLTQTDTNIVNSFFQLRLSIKFHWLKSLKFDGWSWYLHNLKIYQSILLKNYILHTLIKIIQSGQKILESYCKIDTWEMHIRFLSLHVTGLWCFKRIITEIQQNCTAFAVYLPSSESGSIKVESPLKYKGYKQNKFSKYMEKQICFTITIFSFCWNSIHHNN